MAMAGRLRSGLPLLNRILRSNSLSATGSAVQRSIICPAFTSECSKNYATSSGQKEVRVKDLAVPSDTRVKAINEICAQAKFSDITKNFLVVLAENARLRHIDDIAKRFVELTMADRGEVKAVVTTVIPLPPEEEKQLKETLQDVIGQGKKVKLEQKIDPSILGGLVVEFGQKVFDMSIKTRAKQMERFLREPINFSTL
ncbi:ATP synthase delta chain, putative [Ricinus communis]|uniref:ATP synthase delta chain, putative n=1 Tax=Ricinus communis TaxID=3988 RepID=B9T0Y7_RICCO|nr:ATP synthase delta chain, putative [Ricinus communis]